MRINIKCVRTYYVQTYNGASSTYEGEIRVFYNNTLVNQKTSRDGYIVFPKNPPELSQYNGIFEPSAPYTLNFYVVSGTVGRTNNFVYGGETYSFSTAIGSQRLNIAAGSWDELLEIHPVIPTSPPMFSPEMVISGIDSGNDPYMEVLLKLVPPAIISPIGGYIDPSKEQTFRWTASQYQAQAQVRFAQGGTSYGPYTVSGAVGTYTVPANTFTANQPVTWAVKVADADGVWSDEAPLVFLTTTPAIPEAPDLISPVNILVNNSDTVEFRWAYRSSDGSTQGSALLEVSGNQGQTWTQYNIADSTQSYTIPANTLAVGTYLWKVTGYNANGQIGPVSAVAEFRVYGKPAAPIITSISAGTAKPTVYWASADQTAFDLQVIRDGVILYEHHEADNDREHTIADFLDDGPCIVRLRVTGSFGIDSDWTEAALMVVTVKPAAPTVFAGEYDGGIRVIADVTGDNVVSAIIYRTRLDDAHTDGLFDDTKTVAVSTSEDRHIVFDDYSAASGTRYRYVVRAVTSGNTFADSAGAVGVHRIRGVVLALAEAPGQYRVHIVYNAGNPVLRKAALGMDGAAIYYEGRRLPVYEYSEFESSEWSLSAIFRSMEQVAAFQRLLRQRKPILYRDQHGRKMYVSINRLSSVPGKLYTAFELPFEEVDYRE